MDYFQDIIQKAFKKDFKAKIAKILDVEQDRITLKMQDDINSKAPGYLFTIVKWDKKNEHLVSFFTMIQMPGCCGVVVSTGSLVSACYRKKGIGTLLNLFRIEIAKILGYSLIFCTDVTENTAESRILEKNGWKIIDRFLNKRTNNNVNLSVFHIKR